MNTAFLSALALPLPRIEVQQEIVGMLNARLVGANRLYYEILQGLTALATVPGAMLRRAFGEAL